METCDTKYPVRNLVTVGGPNNGVDIQDDCGVKGEANVRCEVQDKILSLGLVGPYSKVVQITIGPSNYFKDHTNRQGYLESASFLPYLNNEIEHKDVSKNK